MPTERRDHAGHRLGGRHLTPTGSVWLDLMRAGAAALVMIGHVRGLFFVDYASVDTQSALMMALYFATGLGHQAVMIFFVLSGYFIAASALGAMADGRWSWRFYLSRRWTRLTIVLWPALLIGAAFDHLGLALFGVGGPYGAAEAYRHIVPIPVDDRLGLATALGNAAYLQEIVVSPFGSNGPLWSLSYEFWYYLLFPAALIAVSRKASMAHRIAHAALAIAVAAFVGERVLLYFLIWLLGVAAVLAPVPAPLRTGGLVRRIAILALGGSLLVSLAASKSDLLPGFAGDIAVGTACAALIWTLQSAGPITRPTLVRLAPKLAGFSYTLYLAHLPPLVFGAAAVVANGGARWQPDAMSLAAGIVIAAATLAYAYALSRITEAKTAWVRARLFGN